MLGKGTHTGVRFGLLDQPKQTALTAWPSCKQQTHPSASWEVYALALSLCLLLPTTSLEHTGAHWHFSQTGNIYNWFTCVVANAMCKEMVFKWSLLTGWEPSRWSWTSPIFPVPTPCELLKRKIKKQFLWQKRLTIDINIPK